MEYGVHASWVLNECRKITRPTLFVVMGALRSFPAAVWVVGGPVCCMACFDRWRSFVLWRVS